MVDDVPKMDPGPCGTKVDDIEHFVTVVFFLRGEGWRPLGGPRSKIELLMYVSVAPLPKAKSSQHVSID